VCALVGIAADDDDDGAQASADHVTAAVNDEPRIVAALTKKIRAAKDGPSRAAEIARAKKGVTEGKLSEKSLDSLLDLALALDEKDAAEQREPALAS
jgi:hypothetical protein